MPKKSKNKTKKYLASIFVAAFLTAVVWLAWPSHQAEPSNQSQTKNNSSPNNTNPVEFNKSQYPTDVASSLWVVVNKGRALPGNYIPSGLVVPNVPLRQGSASSEMHVRSDTAAALEKMFAAAKAQGINLKLTSGYRSYSLQVSVYNGYVASDGVAKADTYSARPGHSEHQTGLAADVEPLSGRCELDICFESTPEGQWVAANAYQYGFIVRYAKDTQNLTGYQYEPWHVRYVGTELAQEIHKTNQTLEQFFGLDTFSDYPGQSLQLKGVSE
jgi:D-alanyl-D-alanine carboxypeptidase